MSIEIVAAEIAPEPCNNCHELVSVPLSDALPVKAVEPPTSLTSNGVNTG
ncbi:MAG: hypothetical protein MJ219_04005 [Mycoplasmoidaceae bacterium]|nr:hypothetical protein [Mycoplasmoidaceae bacterium]